MDQTNASTERSLFFCQWTGMAWCTKWDGIKICFSLADRSCLPACLCGYL